MAVEVKRVVLWRIEVENEPGILAGVLEPLAEAGADLQVVMAYRFPGNHDRAAIEVYPVSGAEEEKAAERAGLTAADIPALLVQGDNKPGLGRAVSESLSEIGINIAFLVAHVIGGKYAAVVGFDNNSDLQAAEPIIRKVAENI